MRTQNISFKGCIPVEFYARHPRTGFYVPVLKQENIRKCQSFVVRNLNNPDGKNSNKDFINKYRQIDKDYSKNPIVASVYEKDAPIVHMATGYDAMIIKEMGKNLGKSKKEVFEETGETYSSETRFLARKYFQDARNYIKKMCTRVKDKDGAKLKMSVYFNPIYGYEKKVKKFEYEDVKFSITTV